MVVHADVPPENLPEVTFDEGQARTIFPKPAPKQAVLITIPLTEDGQELPTIIKPLAGGLQVFYGSFYGLLNSDGDVRRGSARAQWENMHVKVGPGYWVKVTLPKAYQADQACRIVTLIPSAQGGDVVREHSDIVHPGDWIVRQPGGELQYIRAAKYSDFYHTQEEAEALGLQLMTPAEFSAWAIEQARANLHEQALALWAT